MQIVVLLRGVTPVGKNKIPKMSYLAKILEDVGFTRVRTYIQSGNIILDTNVGIAETSAVIHDTILEKIGADLAVIIKSRQQLETAVKENPFDNGYDYSRIHFVFTNDIVCNDNANIVKSDTFDGEEFEIGSQCFYMYLPRDAKKKKLSTNYLEKKIKITATMRKINVIQKLIDMLE